MYHESFPRNDKVQVGFMDLYYDGNAKIVHRADCTTQWKCSYSVLPHADILLFPWLSELIDG